MPPDPADNVELDDVSKATLSTIAGLGYTVNIRRVGDLVVATAHGQEGQTFIARGPDFYSAAVELARQVGIDLADR